MVVLCNLSRMTTAAALLALALLPPALTARPHQPDVSISPQDIVFSNDYPQTGEVVYINVTAHNLGDVDSGVVTVKFYIDTIPYPPDKMIANIEPNGTATASTTWLAAVPKTYTVRVVLECSLDANSANNEASRTLTVSMPGGSLMVSARLEPERCRPSQLFYVNGTVKIVNAPVTGASVTVTVKPQGPTGTTTTNSEGAFSVNLTAPEAGGSYAVETTASSGTQRGTDTDTLTVIMPDLIIASLVFSPENATEGKAVELVALVRNSGTDAADNVSVAFFRGTVRIGTKSVGELGPGNQSEVRISWTAIRGSHEIRAEADPDKRIAELDEANNSLSRTLEVREKVEGEGRGFLPFAAAISAVLIIVALVALVLWKRRRRAR
ncbi:MAG: CARDB domain-containing protein [Thermoplasmata archaeon]